MANVKKKNLRRKLRGWDNNARKDKRGITIEFTQELHDQMDAYISAEPKKTKSAYIRQLVQDHLRLIGYL